MREAAELPEQAEKALRLARQTTDDLTSARLTILAKENIARARALENSRKPLNEIMSQIVPTEGRRFA
jgi:hypothetical protein